LIDRFDGDLSALVSTDGKALSRLPGIGPAKAALLSASLELARRTLVTPMKERNVLSSPQAVRDWLRLSLGSLPHEVFVALWLDAQNRLIDTEELFRGTLTQTSVYPREIVKRALACNAGAVIFAHNHPSGVAEPSHADQLLTTTLKQALALVDVRMLDHFIVAGNGQPVSFAERGMM
jgi:DNA repair protein RadC